MNTGKDTPQTTRPFDPSRLTSSSVAFRSAFPIPLFWKLPRGPWCSHVPRCNKRNRDHFLERRHSQLARNESFRQ